MIGAYTARSMSSRCVYLSIMPDSTIRKKPDGFFDSTSSAAPTCSVKSGCSGNLPTVPPLTATFVEREAGKDQSALLLRDVSLADAGVYNIRVTHGGVETRELRWNVYDTGPRKAKNVILFIGDGMSPAHRVAARLLAKGIAEGKALGKLALDDMPHMALVATAGSDSIITDSANSASAYATGHKSAVNAMGVYADRTPDPLDDPRVETVTSLAQRNRTWR